MGLDEGEKLAVLMARIDERTQAMQNDLIEMRRIFVTRAEFFPVKAIVFSGAGLVLVSVMGALVALVVIR